MEHYSALKKEALIHATTWINLESFILSERSQAKSPHIIIPLFERSKLDKLIDTPIR